MTESRDLAELRYHWGEAYQLAVWGGGWRAQRGPRPAELVSLRGRDVIRHGRRASVHVSGPAVRVVPVAADYAGRAAGLAAARDMLTGSARSGGPGLQELRHQLRPHPGG